MNGIVFIELLGSVVLFSECSVMISVDFDSSMVDLIVKLNEIVFAAFFVISVESVELLSDVNFVSGLS